MSVSLLDLSEAHAQDSSRKGQRRLLAAGIVCLLLTLAAGSFLLYRQAQRAEWRIICFGDSLTACGGFGGRYSDHLAQQFPACEVLNRGVPGDTLDGGRNRFQQDVLSLHPRLVILELGANDFHQQLRPIEKLEADLEYMLSALHDRGIKTLLAGVFGPQLDPRGQWVEKRYAEGSPAFGAAILEMERRLARKYGCVHIENIQADLLLPEDWADPRHPSAAGNKKVAARLQAPLAELLAQCKAEKEQEQTNAAGP